MAFINVEEVRNAKKEGTTREITISISGKAGNTDTKDYLVESILYTRNTQKEYLALIAYEYGESQQIEDANNLNLHLRHSFALSPHLFQEVYGQYQTNKFTRLSFRGLLGTGVRFPILSSEKLYFYLGAGAFYSSETLEERVGTTDDGTLEIGRGNFYIAAARPIGERTLISGSVYFQPNFRSVHDHRVHGQTTFKFNVEKNFSLSLFYKVAHDNEPPELVKTTDSQYGTKLHYIF
ncbi:MAG: DUF481 domain-containing protein [Bdellovibrionales bacterium]|nr:DUF481 domain-containing protein [Bdellovibrionales bacterium]